VFDTHLSPSYDSYYEEKAKGAEGTRQMYQVWREIVSDPENEYAGTILDLGCGTGAVGKLIREKYPSARLTGVDISPEMVVNAQETYQTIHLGLMENVIMDTEKLGGSFNHVVALAVFQFINREHFALILNRAFELATNSVTLTVEDMPEKYAQGLLKINPTFVMFDHVDYIEDFVPPKGWCLAGKRRDLLWTSIITGIKVDGITVWYKRMKIENGCALL
jgi:cyclopropane fatty-acyl-phospholipid synthase-like methyltransferase